MEKILQVLEDFDAPSILALINALGGRENALDIMAGKKKVTVEDVVQLLFDRNGRGIPFFGMKGVVDADRLYYLTRPLSIDYAGVLARLQKFYGSEYEFLSVDEFQKRCEAVFIYIKGEQQIANLLNGPHFVFALPNLTGDLGILLDNVIVPAMERSYRDQFPDRYFTNHCRNGLIGQVTVITGTRQDRLIQAMAHGPVCGVFFPALQGFSIPADHEFVTKTPERLILAGMEVPAVVAAYPEVLFLDFHTPGLDMAALRWQFSGRSFYCKADDSAADFGGRIITPGGHCAGGVSILG